MVLVLSNISGREEGKKINAARREELLRRTRRRDLARGRSRVRFAAAWVAAVEQEKRERKRERDEIRKLSESVAAWEKFTRQEQRELEFRKNGQLARLLGAPLPGEQPALLQRLADDDQLQAKKGLVALMSGGNTVYKNIEDLAPEDMPARIAANRLRTTWLKERRDQWLGRWELPL